MTPLVADVLSPARSVRETSASLSFHTPAVANNGLRRDPGRQQGKNGKFRTLEEECNWILSGRQPPPPHLNNVKENGGEDDDDDNTLDDISGDEVSFCRPERTTKWASRRRSRMQ